jgi:hypothetical protein
VGDGLNRAHQLVEILDALLQQVRPPFRAGFEERERIPRIGVLAEDDDADVRVRLSQALRGPDSLVDAVRRHPDVGDDDVGLLLFDSGEKRVKIATGGRDLHLGMCLGKTPDALANEIVIVREYQADRHRHRIRRHRPRL